MQLMSQGYHIHISSDRRLIGLNLKEVWKYRDLIWLLSQRTFRLTYKQTILGPAWIILSPLITSVIYTIVFGHVVGLSTEGVPRLCFYLCSNALWSFFAECLEKNTSTFIDNAAVFGKVYFPRLTVAVSNVLSAAIRFLIQLAMVLILVIFYAVRGEVDPNWAMIPLIIPLILVTGIMGMGLGVLISGITTRYRDLLFLVGFGLQLWMYASPVIYPLSQLGTGTLHSLLILNPMTAPMEGFRKILLNVGDISPVSVISTVVFTLAAALLGIIIFNRVEKYFIDVV